MDPENSHTYPTDKHELSTGGVQAIIVSFIFTALATVAVALRFYVRQIKRIRPLAEDWMIVAALVSQANGVPGFSGLCSYRLLTGPVLLSSAWVSLS